MNAKWLLDPLSIGHKIFPFSLCLLFLDGIKVCPTSLSDLYITENTKYWQGWVGGQNASLMDKVKWKEIKGSHQNSEQISEFIRLQFISRGQKQEQERSRRRRRNRNYKKVTMKEYIQKQKFLAEKIFGVQMWNDVLTTLTYSSIHIYR